jgi:hypothetical protein
VSRRRRWATRDTWVAVFWLAAGFALAVGTDAGEWLR